MEDAIGYYVSDISIFEKLPFCAIFVPFHFYLVMTLVVSCLDNIFMVLLISELAEISAVEPIFFGFWFPWGEGGVVNAWSWFVIIV